MIYQLCTGVALLYSHLSFLSKHKNAEFLFWKFILKQYITYIKAYGMGNKNILFKMFLKCVG